MTSAEATLFDPGPMARPVPPAKLQAGTGHAAVRVTHNGRAALIDEPLAPLILELWKAGIDTNSCCQASNSETGSDEGGLANIVLPAGDAEAFLTDLTAWPSDPDLYGRITPIHTKPAPDDWRLYAWPYDEGQSITILVKMFFPLDDVPGLVRRLQERKTQPPSPMH